MAKKKRKALLPKRIAGVKVPKSVRKGRLGELLASHTGRVLLAEAVAAAGAIGAAQKASAAAGDSSAIRKAADAAAERLRPGPGPGGEEAGAALGFALGEAARAFVAALGAHSRTQAPAPAHDGWDVEAEAPGGSKKKPASSPPPNSPG